MCDKTISVFQFMKAFPTEESARMWFEKQRWGEKPICPTCGSERITTLKREGYYECRDCKGKFTVRVGTVMHRSHIDLTKWLYTMYRIVTARKGVSSMELSKELGIRQASTWFLMQRIREAMKAGDSFLEGIVEIDETYMAAKRRTSTEAKN